MMSDDFFRDLRLAVAEASGDGFAVERYLRERWAGERVYIPAGGGEARAAQAGALAAVVAAGTSPAKAFAFVGVARRTGYRLLRRNR